MLFCPHMMRPGTSPATMLERRRWCKLISAVLALCVFGIVYLGYFCPGGRCALRGGGTPSPVHKLVDDDEPEKTISDSILVPQNTVKNGMRNTLAQDSRVSVDTSVNRYDFDIEGEDVLVFLHIQKTGGTVFGRHLVKNLDVDVPCACVKGRKRCDCYSRKKHIWLFSRFSTGWRCGVHADWTELQACVPEVMDDMEKKHRHRRYRYLYLTILRHPLQRYLSEWLHVQRGATWFEAQLKCDGKRASLNEVPFCFSDKNWAGVSLDEFITCPHNLAINRQTRMLANLSLVHCYNFSAMPPEQRDAVMLQSAKDNLRTMAFFGLTAYQSATQHMFETTFNLQFIEDFEDRNVTHAQKTNFSAEQERKIIELNRLDLELYKYAEQLFLERLNKMKEAEKWRTISAHSQDNLMEYDEDIDADYANQRARRTAKRNRRSYNPYRQSGMVS